MEASKFLRARFFSSRTVPGASVFLSGWTEGARCLGVLLLGHRAVAGRKPAPIVLDLLLLLMLCAGCVGQGVV